MIRSRLFRTIVAFIVLVLVTPVQASYGLQSQRDAEDAAEEAIELSELESQGRAAGLYRRLHPDAKELIPKEAVVGWYETDFFPLDPQPIIEITGVEFVTWTWPVTGQSYRNTAEVSYIQPFGSGANVTYTEEVVRLVEEDGDWHWFFGRSREFVDTQIARFPAEQERESTARSTKQRSQETATRVSRSSTGCTMVELFPGYPMYRGVVTGMLWNWGGLGDWACLEDLERIDPSFDIDAENQANLEAARELGINGDAEDWLWENWMQIEAARSLPTQCYSCVLFDPMVVPMNTGVVTDPNDPRILAGFPDGQYALNTFTSNGQTIRYFENDYVLRSAAFLWYGGLLNAPELIDMYQHVIEQVSSAGGESLDYELVLEVYFETGGYTWTPDTASRQDQQFMAATTWWTGSKPLVPLFRDVQLDEFQRLVDEWRIHGQGEPLRTYLARNWSL